MPRVNATKNAAIAKPAVAHGIDRAPTDPKHEARPQRMQPVAHAARRPMLRRHGVYGDAAIQRYAVMPIHRLYGNIANAFATPSASCSGVQSFPIRISATLP